MQDHTGISNVAAADAPLRVLPLSVGQSDSALEVADPNAVNEGRIHDCISNLKFSISPTAFFQVCDELFDVMLLKKCTFYHLKVEKTFLKSKFVGQHVGC